MRIAAYLLVIWMVGLGGLEPPTSPLSVVNKPPATGADGLRQIAIRLCLCALGAGGAMLPAATSGDRC